MALSSTTQNIIIGFAAGAVVMFFVRAKYWQAFSQRARLIAKYWISVTIFTLVAASSCVAVFVYAGSNLNAALNVWGIGVTLLFAILVGYYAFAQVAIAQANNLTESIRNSLGVQDFRRAQKTLEQKYGLDPNNYATLAELEETYLINGQNDSFDKNLDALKRLIIEDRDKVTVSYLVTTKHLLDQHMVEAKAALKGIVDIEGQVPKSERILMSWSFNEVIGSARAKSLSGDARKMFDNFIKYLTNQLSDEELQKFRSEDYLLTPPP